MTQVPPPPDLRPPVPTQLIVFADDWGRHPSSSQHLVRELLPQYPTLWVNTVGTRRPRLHWSDAKRVAGKLAECVSHATSSFVRKSRAIIDAPPANLTVIAPTMYPGFRSNRQRRFNQRRLLKAIRPHLLQGHRRVVVTTLPITADLVGALEVDRWVYYCVDDYAQWPGVDLEVMRAMERALVTRVDQAAAVSLVLRDHLRQIRDDIACELIPHGVELDHWNGTARQQWNADLNPDNPDDDPWWWFEPPGWIEHWREQSVALFWGLLDERLEIDWVKAIKASGSLDRVALVGPTNAPPAGLVQVAELPGPVPYAQLPAIAHRAAVLIMPYIDAPVTRAMQPLKLLEYLATMKPVVVRDLPSTRAWADCCDLASDAERFTRLVAERAKTGTPPEQIAARKRRLPGESWTAKAAQLAAIINQGA